MRPASSPRLRALSLIAFVLLAGCAASDRGFVSGTLLRHDGKPLVGARVIARSPETGNSAYGTTDDKGHFELGIETAGDGIPPGTYQITIVEDRGDADRRLPATISSKYRDSAESGLNLTVEAGQQSELNLTLDPPGR